MSETRAPILAFSHIGKTGGTTLIHLLRRNYFLRYCDVRPLRKSSGKLFTGSDMRETLRINPFLECITGHSIRPYSDLRQQYPNIQYITLIRDPIGRCISQYQQRVKKYGHIEFREFLSRSWLPNLQTRFVAGNEDIDKAKHILSNEFLLAGVLDEFDEFLAVLVHKLKPKAFDPAYTMKRVERDKTTKAALLEQHGDEIRALHQLDLELYRFVKEELFAKAKKSLGNEFSTTLSQIKDGKAQASSGFRIRAYSDYVLRKAYYEPVLGAVRLMRGLPAR